LPAGFFRFACSRGFLGLGEFLHGLALFDISLAFQLLNCAVCLRIIPSLLEGARKQEDQGNKENEAKRAD